MSFEEQETEISEVDTFPQVPNIYDVRFRSAISSLEALESNMPRIQKILSNIREPMFELVKDVNVNLTVLEIVNEVGARVKSQIDKFEKTDAKIFDVIPSYLAEIEWSLKPIAPTDRFIIYLLSKTCHKPRIFRPKAHIDFELF